MIVRSPQSPLLQDLAPHLLSGFSNVEILDLIDAKVGQDLSSSVVVADNLQDSELVNRFLMNNLRHLVQRNPHLDNSEVEIAGRLIESPVSFLNRTIECLMPAPLNWIIQKFDHTTSKTELKELTLDWAAKAGRQNVLESVDVIFEELYMNAILDAPREADKRGWQADLYDKRSFATLEMAYDARRLFLVCSDPFGALDGRAFLGRLREVLQKGMGQSIRTDSKQGAGIGCSLIYEHASSLILAHKPQVRTVVACSIPLGLSYRQRAKTQKSLHLIEF